MKYKEIDLKSNMDRFIVQNQSYKPYMNNHLKSNMDRFIVNCQSCH